eukprot:GHVS01075870.1.p1 GENE.GHVS01075870.1~~GHVS01075870.1.p1  ORF type:complete len:112 (+),score=15.33 GHVS01075870.1:642-977(+)
MVLYVERYPSDQAYIPMFAAGADTPENKIMMQAIFTTIKQQVSFSVRTIKHTYTHICTHTNAQTATHTAVASLVGIWSLGFVFSIGFGAIFVFSFGFGAICVLNNCHAVNE